MVGIEHEAGAFCIEGGGGTSMKRGDWLWGGPAEALSIGGGWGIRGGLSMGTGEGGIEHREH